MIVTIKDTTFTGKTVQQIDLEFASASVMVKDIITERVLQEVEQYNQKRSGYFNGLVEPTEAEQTTNGYQLDPKKIIDGEKQVYVALDAFQKNGYFVLVDDIQAESLEQRVQLKADTDISFVKLTPLVGG